MRVYRLASQRFSANDGLGASLFGGRWNRKGTPVIYTGASRALCALEILANANALADDYMVTPIEVPEDLSVVTLSVDELPSGWDAAQPTPATAEMGTAWAEKLQSAVLIVPSAIIPQEQNYILNPLHPDFSKLAIGAPEQFRFDDRLWRAWQRK